MIRTVFLIILLVGCSDGVGKRKLEEFVINLETSSRTIGKEEIAKISIPKLEKGEFLVIINGGYVGGLEARQGIDEKLAADISLGYGGDRFRGNTSILYIKKGQIESTIFVSQENLVTDFTPRVTDNAKIAGYGSKNITALCAPKNSRSNQKITSQHWNDKCTLTIISIE